MKKASHIFAFLSSLKRLFKARNKLNNPLTFWVQREFEFSALDERRTLFPAKRR